MLIGMDSKNSDTSQMVAAIHKLRKYEFKGSKFSYSTIYLDTTQFAILYIDVDNMEYWFSSVETHQECYYIILPEQWPELSAYVEERFEEYLIE
jgi:hypothetical protein